MHLSDQTRNQVNPSVDAPVLAGMHPFSLRKKSCDGLKVAGMMTSWLKHSPCLQRTDVQYLASMMGMSQTPVTCTHVYIHTIIYIQT